MRIVSLKAENFKRLKAVDITLDPSKPLVQITGKNAQGKTAILDCIIAAIAGSKSRVMKETPQPIREGAERAEIIIDLGEYVVNRRWASNDKTYLEVVTKDNASIKSPQALLDKFYGDLSFDPLEYLNMKPADKLKTLISMVKLDIDPVQIDEQVKKVYDDRTALGREVKRVEGILNSFPPVPQGMDIPNEEVSVSNILEEKRKAEDIIKLNDEKRTKLDGMRFNFARLKNETDKKVNEYNEALERVSRIQGELAQINLQREEVAALGKDLELEVGDLVDPDTTKYDAMLMEMENINRSVRVKKDRASREEELTILKSQYESHTKQLSDLDETKREAIKRAVFPVKGLSFNDTEVLWNKLPLTQASSAEQLRVSLAMAASANPELRVIHIKNGSLLDSDSMKEIEDYATLNDCQIWCERVDESGKIGFYVEDGMVTSIDGEPVMTE